MKTILSEVFVSLVLVIFLILLLNPFSLLMPSPMEMIIILGFALAFIIFVGFFWKEKVADERESLHRYIAGRIAYFTGVTLLTVGIIIQSLQHSLDKWLVISLTGMVIGKIIGLFYGRFKH
ncbi:hypothetical protein A3C28_02790 [Candidatus Roizmanbacteria bacterium RIFCSPHIGHO2_02_FULL_39_9]|uniref:Uncharacterized protein n=2 Tax=Candidatus Roizmaniibacteriota TaxID=1752723 RepID=A0A1F7I028_9BACT|nr:MAG: hypothetical protein A3C28_02790 [Candidatus Roizmanbacteria bacterium RIFCSPHIGHO2_02_FULL_39_9]OGK36731.1 MAG: hypothetical protein A3F60_02990 [Candidatus Roizmanbacteria bacterium RIFCSPHIGHO2_12_FULL_39_8]